MFKILKTKPFVNKSNNQISIILPRRKMKIPEGMVPKKIKLRIEDIEYGPKPIIPTPGGFVR